ncbi:MAG: glycosyltransferase, partial [Bacteroidetes bacterium]|nr:glycosyltransferase [Bacteroidota bacterium]
VSNGIAEEFKQRYGSEYEVIRNMPVLRSLTTVQSQGKFILYQGVVNEARAFEFLIPAMKKVEAKLVVCGDGNFMSQLKILVTQNGVENKVELKGMLTPADLWAVAQTAYIGIAVAESDGLNQHLALPNKFFDYIHAVLPQVTMNYPEYKKLNDQYEVAILINDLTPETIASALNNLLQNDVLYRKLRDNCLRAREALNWKEEEKKLVRFYKTKVFTE